MQEELRVQMELKKQREAEEKAREREEEAKLEKRIQEQQERMRREFEEEQAKKKAKEQAVSFNFQKITAVAEISKGTLLQKRSYLHLFSKCAQNENKKGTETEIKFYYFKLVK